MMATATDNGKGKGKTRAVDLLEVEDDEARQARMHDVLQRLDASSGAKPADAFPKFDFGDRRTFPVDPPSELLSRVQAFLPELAASNAELARRAEADPDSVDIEHLVNSEQYIEMNLGLGVFETHKRSDNSDPMDADDDEGEREDKGVPSKSSADLDSDSSTDSSETSSNSSSELDAEDDHPEPRPTKSLPTRRKPRIVVLDDL